MKIYTGTKYDTYHLDWGEPPANTTADMIYTHTDNTTTFPITGDPEYVKPYKQSVMPDPWGKPSGMARRGVYVPTEQEFERIANTIICKFTKDQKKVELTMWEWFQLKQMRVNIEEQTLKELTKALVAVKL